MDEQKKSLIDRIKQAQNILVTVSSNPSVDQLSAAIGLTLALNKLDKHGTAVFSGEVPSTLEFLKPEETLEKNTDSLRDFIIALDKSKADKLRYKVEDEVVRIFITPYKTSLSKNDLEFSQGDFNVDVVVALGVNEQKDLDGAITAHGRILHDATVATVSNVQQSSLGTLNWVEPNASSLSEMMTSLIEGLDKRAIDGQIATALLTGIVATTERFSNEKTTPKTMSASAELMAAGANQQLIATELETPSASVESSASYEPTSAPTDEPVKKVDPGTLEIAHEEESEAPETPDEPAPEAEKPHPQVHVDENGQLVMEGDAAFPKISQIRGVSNDGKPTEAGNGPKRERITEPPQFNDNELTANAAPEKPDVPTEELAKSTTDAPLLTHNERNLDDASQQSQPAVLTPLPSADPAPAPQPAATPAPVAPEAHTTLTEIEQAVASPHIQTDAGTVDSARSAVENALNTPNAPSDPLQPIAALNAQPLGDALHQAPSVPVANTGFNEPSPGNTPADDTLDMPLPSSPFGPGQQAAALPPLPTPPSALPGTPPPSNGQTPPPPVPPPMLPPLQ